MDQIRDGALLSGKCALRLLCLCFASILLGAASAKASVPAVTGATQTASFAIADFDGDQRPDLASVESGRDGSSSTDYWIELQLTASTRQPIRLVAPSGGLLIQATDVNGDHSIDLVLATAWLKYPVAIFLNDGHGGFSRAAPDRFLKAFSRSSTKWLASMIVPIESVGVPPEPLAGVSFEADYVSHLHFQSAPVLSFGSHFLPDSFVVSHAGRAPPFASRQS